MGRSFHIVDRVKVTFDDEHLVANAGLILVATLAVRLELEAVVDRLVRLSGRVGGSRPGREVLTLGHAIVAGGSHTITPTCCARAAPSGCCRSR